MALATSLSSYWKLDESSGNASDSVGGKTLTNTGTVTYSAGKLNNGANFNGSSQYFTFSPIALSNTSFSISAWFYQNTNTPGVIFHEGVDGNNNSYLQLARGGATGGDWVMIARDNSTVGLVDQFSSAVTFNTWHHVVWTMTTTSAQLYVDGVLIRTTSFTANSFTANNGRIGSARRASEEGYWGGSIDEVAVWTKTLTADEVSQIYNSNRANAYPLTDTPSLYGGLSYWKLDESSGNAADSVGSNTAVNSNVTYSAGKINNGAVFNGSSAKLLPTDITIFNGDFSVSMWVKRNADQDGYIFGRTQTASPYGTFNIYFSNSSKTLIPGVYATNATFQLVTTTTTLTAGIWYHIVFTISSTTMKAYINGTQEGGDVTFSGTRANVGVTNFGMRYADSAVPYSGSLDEVGVWSRALSSTEVTALYNSGNGVQYPFPTTNIKSIDGLAYSSVKSIDGLAVASVKSIDGLA